MPILLRTQVDRTDKTPVTARRARVGGLCGFRGTAEHVPARSPKTGRCADVRGCCGNSKRRRSKPAGSFRQKTEPQAAKPAENRAASGEAGESQGVVCAPWQTHLPAVRAVLGDKNGAFLRGLKMDWR